ncbi:MAG: RNA-protein complex protein Nop10 [Candidatus Methanoperedens sp.]|nr:RNA-protein complex protein Nop10 [Candidatus Methanoperedens sp.]MCZ7373047.1 RNA-protein complex protein Nop10 [Candidatus Methanoperedens sp.]MCZ7397516.1 RNA-protein complex protein Nop10 [Candidatus Methanoperedens sp.]
MVSKIRKCSCGRFTLKEICPVCGKATKYSQPARFSLEDRYGKYRRMAKRGSNDKNYDITD